MTFSILCLQAGNDVEKTSYLLSIKQMPQRWFVKVSGAQLNIEVLSQYL